MQTKLFLLNILTIQVYFSIIILNCTVNTYNLALKYFLQKFEPVYIVYRVTLRITCLILASFF